MTEQRSQTPWKAASWLGFIGAFISLSMATHVGYWIAAIPLAISLIALSIGSWGVATLETLKKVTAELEKIMTQY